MKHGRFAGKKVGMQGVLLVIPVAVVVVAVVGGLPPPTYGSLPVEPGSFSLTNSYAYGTNATNWMQFNFTVNTTRVYRLVGAWVATEPTWVTTAYAVFVDHGFVESFGGAPCIAPVGSTCPWNSHPYRLNGTLDVRIPFGGCIGNGSWELEHPGQEAMALLFQSAHPATITVTQRIVLQEVADHPCIV